MGMNAAWKTYRDIAKKKKKKESLAVTVNLLGGKSMLLLRSLRRFAAIKR